MNKMNDNDNNKIKEMIIIIRAREENYILVLHMEKKLSRTEHRAQAQ